MSVEDSYGFGWYHAMHPDDLDATRKAWSTIGTERLDLKMRLRRWDGEYRWHLVQFYFVYFILYIYYIFVINTDFILSLGLFHVTRRTVRIWFGLVPPPTSMIPKCTRLLFALK